MIVSIFFFLWFFGCLFTFFLLSPSLLFLFLLLTSTRMYSFLSLLFSAAVAWVLLCALRTFFLFMYN